MNKMQPRLSQDEYQKIFSTEYEKVFASPARTNIIGEHLDYNGGLVLPCAISLYAYAYVAKRSDKKVCLYTESKKVEDAKRKVEVDLNNLDYNPDNSWANYPIGLIDILKKNNKNIDCGFNVYYESKIPVGCGLSSSAAILVLTCTFLNDLYNLNLSSKEIIEYSVKTETDYIKVSSGIMDESIITLAKENSCLLLDCKNFKYEYLPFNLGDYELVVLNTNKHRLLQESKYNERVAECHKALDILKKHYDIESLPELKVPELDNIKKILNDDILYRRVKYVVSENERVLRFCEELKKEKIDINVLANILNEGHLGLSVDYEVSGMHLDLICKSALSAGAIAARMTGAGFGGCAIAIVKKDLIDRFIKTLKETYFKACNLECEVYRVEIVGNASKLWG